MLPANNVHAVRDLMQSWGLALFNDTRNIPKFNPHFMLLVLSSNVTQTWKIPTDTETKNHMGKLIPCMQTRDIFSTFQIYSTSLDSYASTVTIDLSEA